MLRENKNIRDTNNLELDIAVKDVRLSMSYIKSNKLITALYMVTDIIDKEEPIRNKLRTLGLEILSDTFNTSRTSFEIGKIDQIISYLDIASAMSFISEMNCNILKKEFFAFKISIEEYKIIKPTWLTEFLENSPLEEWSRTGVDKIIPSLKGELKSKGHRETHKGHQLSTRIGVQKASTLMKALFDKTNFMSDRNYPNSSISRTQSYLINFNILKKQRRDEIINIIKNNGGGANIKDIIEKKNTEVQGPLTFSEKTLQRELASMIKDDVLNKTGEKRWSKYFIK